MKIQHKCDNYSNLCDNNVTYKPNCLSKSIQLQTASLLYKNAWSIDLCVDWHRVTFLNMTLWSLPGQFYGDITIFEGVFTICGVVWTVQRARKCESKWCLKNTILPFLVGPDAPIILAWPDFMVCFPMLCVLVRAGRDWSRPGWCQEQPLCGSQPRSCECKGYLLYLVNKTSAFLFLRSWLLDSCKEDKKSLRKPEDVHLEKVSRGGG